MAVAKFERIEGNILGIIERAPSRWGKGLTIIEGINRAAGELVIPSNRRLTELFIGFYKNNDAVSGMTDDQRALYDTHWRSKGRCAFPCWSSTMTGYVEPGKPLPNQIEFMDIHTKVRWIFPVPEEHRGKVNVILAAELPNYLLEQDGRNIVVHATNVDVVGPFPEESMRCRADPIHGLPISASDGFSIFFHRIDSRVGPTSRTNAAPYLFGESWFGWDDVDLGEYPSQLQAILVDIAASNIPDPYALRERKFALTATGDLVVSGTSAQLDAVRRLIEANRDKLEPLK